MRGDEGEDTLVRDISRGFHGNGYNYVRPPAPINANKTDHTPTGEAAQSVNVVRTQMENGL